MSEPFLDNPDEAVTGSQDAAPQLSIAIGQVTSTDDSGQFIEATDTFWEDTEIVNHYEGDGHRYVAGVTSPSGFNGGTAAVFQLAARTLIWYSDWTCASSRSQPEIPDWDTGNPNDILLDDHYELPKITVNGDGATPIYRISGTYYYVRTNPSDTFVNDLAFPRPAWLADFCDRTMPESKLLSDLNTTSANVFNGILGSGGDIIPPSAQP